MADAGITAPFFPIIYVRGYAGTDSEIEDTVSDPYMGFNLGSTRIRTLWTGETERFYFESPLVRLMKDFNYRDVYTSGKNMTELKELPPGQIAGRSIIVYRYYDEVSSTFGSGKQIAMEDFGAGLSKLILTLRDRTCKTPADRDKFRVYLIGHSMGGLVIRCFLQNDAIGSREARNCVDKVFTYAAPHNGIEFEIIGNVPAFFTAQSVDNFNRSRMCQYLSLPSETKDVNKLNGKFPVDRFFCLIGTNAKDYAVAAGWSSRVVGPFSDGLVRINNAVVFDDTDDPVLPTKLGPRAYVHRSHSGHYGIVNSEEGYQNLTRFLFGDLHVEGYLEIEKLTLPNELQIAMKKGKEINASYHFECVSRVRGAHWDLSRRLSSENSTVFRKYGELFPTEADPDIDRPNHFRPQLFTAFLLADARVNKRRKSLGFAIDLGVLVPDYHIGGMLWLNSHYPGGYIFRDKINLEAIPPGDENGSWLLRYGFDSKTPNATNETASGTMKDDALEFRIPVVQPNRPGIVANLVLIARNWNAWH